MVDRLNYTITVSDGPSVDEYLLSVMKSDKFHKLFYEGIESLPGEKPSKEEIDDYLYEYFLDDIHDTIISIFSNQLKKFYNRKFSKNVVKQVNEFVSGYGLKITDIELRFAGLDESNFTRLKCKVDFDNYYDGYYDEELAEIEEENFEDPTKKPGKLIGDLINIIQPFVSSVINEAELMFDIDKSIEILDYKAIQKYMMESFEKYRISKKG